MGGEDRVKIGVGRDCDNKRRVADFEIVVDHDAEQAGAWTSV